MGFPVTGVSRKMPVGPLMVTLGWSCLKGESGKTVPQVPQNLFLYELGVRHFKQFMF